MKRHIYAFTLLLSIAACGGSEDDTADTDATSESRSELDSSRQVLAVDFASARDKRLSLNDRVRRASAVLLGGAADTSVVEELREPELHAEGAAKTTTVLRQNLRITHLPETDDLLMINAPVADDHAEGADIGEAAARKIFEATIAQLGRDGLDDMKGLDLSRTKLSRLRQASGKSGQPDTLRSHVKAYVFSAPRTVNGLEILGSSVTIGVHRSGKLASIHSRGALPGAAPASAALASPRARALSSAAVQQRAQADFPGASLQSLGLVYVVDATADAKAAGAVEPREVVVVFPRKLDGSGYSRGRKVSYSVTDARAPVTYLDTQLQNDHGDIRR